MNKMQQDLLLTVAHVLRSKIQNEIYAERLGDLAALNEAMKPFEQEEKHGQAR